MLAVKFIRRWDIYHPGLVACFPTDTSNKLVDQGFAVFENLSPVDYSKDLGDVPTKRTRERIVKK